MDLENEYVKAALSQEDLSVLTATEEETIEAALLRADALWATGNVEDCVRLVAEQEKRSGWLEWHSAHANGLKALAAGNLAAAYDSYTNAISSNLTHPSDAPAAGEGKVAPTTPDIFAAERAVNIAFWLADAKKMVDAANHLRGVTTTRPFAGGILSFAQHLAGDSPLAERTAREAIEAGFIDPWTVHAVVHALYATGQSRACVAWIRERGKKGCWAKCSVFMRTHLEFHLCLALLDRLEIGGNGDANATCACEFMDVIAGPMWGQLTSSERDDYWAATGVLNAFWKAELRGMPLTAEQQAQRAKHVTSALQHLARTGVQVSKSQVFALCILRWTTEESDASTVTSSDMLTRSKWLASMLNQDNASVLVAAAKAVHAAYPPESASSSDSGNSSSSMSGATCVKVNEPNKLNWTQAWAALAARASQLHKLGASPEQREVLEEFALTCSLNAWVASPPPPSSGCQDTTPRSGSGGFVSMWLSKHQRPGVSFYDSMVSISQQQRDAVAGKRRRSGELKRMDTIDRLLAEGFAIEKKQRES